MLLIAVESGDETIGIYVSNLAIIKYLAVKQLSPEQAESFKKISPKYKK